MENTLHDVEISVTIRDTRPVKKYVARITY